MIVAYLIKEKLKTEKLVKSLMEKEK